MKVPKLQRQPEIDALRGLFLVWMVLTHLPTHASDFVNQPFGFVSSAEGFVFVSALLTSRVYLRLLETDEAAFRSKIWARTLQLYGYHLLMLFLAFTLAAALAVSAHKVALYNLLNFYLAHPVTAVLGSILLIYTPPLLDILPMYVLFLALSPYVLMFTRRFGWRPVLGGSAALWLGAQFGLRTLAHNAVVSVTHLNIPLQEAGAFNLFAWQFVWITGMWIGARSAAGRMPLQRTPKWLLTTSIALCAFFIAIRHDWLGPRLTVEIWNAHFDKWHLSPLRIVNLVAFFIVCWSARKLFIRALQIEPLLTLGKASLEVFCAHVLFCFVGLGLLYEDTTQLHGWRATGLLIITFTGLILVAVSEVRKRRRKKQEAAYIAALESKPPHPIQASNPATPSAHAL